MVGISSEDQLETGLDTLFLMLYRVTEEGGQDIKRDPASGGETDTQQGFLVYQEQVRAGYGIPSRWGPGVALPDIHALGSVYRIREYSGDGYHVLLFQVTGGEEVLGLRFQDSRQPRSAPSRPDRLPAGVLGHLPEG
mgnify:CR=1 FL=1